MSMTPAERARMRATIGMALRQAHLPQGDAHAHGATRTAPAAPAGPAAAGPAEVARFRAELEALAGHTHEARSLDDIVRIVTDVVAGQPRPHVLAWSDDALGVPGLGEALERRGLTLVAPHIDPSGAARESQVAAVAAATVGLTGSDAALFTTGSIVVTSGPGRPRLASLVTPVHVALVRVSTLVDGLPTLFARRPDLVTGSANFVCITGPSRTADIEHTLSRGVHGPGTLHAILLP